MAIFGDRIKVACSTTGSTATTLTLGSAVSGFQTLSQGGLSNGDSVRYVIEDGSNFEIGLATYATGSPDTLTGRSDANVSASSSSNNRINLSGSSTLFIAPTAADLQTVHVYSATSDLPSATDNHGMIAHVHGEGAMYFAHGGNWVKLANYSDIVTYSNATTSAAGLMSAADKTKLDGIEASADVTDTTNVVAALTAGSNITISADGTISSTASGGGGSSTSALTETTFSATANQTAFPVSGGITNASNVSVFQNGVKLEEGASKDYTVNASTDTVTLNSGAAAGDVVEVLEYGQPNSITDLSDTPSSLGTAGQVLQVNSGATALEFADASSGSGVTVYTGLSGTDGTPSGATYLLNASNPSAGDLAYVTANTSLYQNNGNGWYRIAVINTTPTISSVADASSNTTPFTLEGGTNTVITVTASDADEGTDLTYSHSVTSGSLNGTTVTQGTGANENVFTITPHASNATTFSITFSVSDSINAATSVAAFTLEFIITDSHYTTLLMSTDGSAGDNNDDISDATGNHTSNITVSDNPSAGTFSPYRHGGYSVEFVDEGSNGYGLQLPAATFNNPSTTFTIEAWVYLKSYSNNGTAHYNRAIMGKGATYLNFGVGADYKVQLYHYDGTPRYPKSTGTVPLNEWTHVCAKVDSGSITFYINGSSSGTGTWYGLHSGHVNTDFYVGMTADTGGNASKWWDGYLSNVRFVDGTAITPSSGGNEALDPTTTNTEFLICASNRFIDSKSTSPLTVTPYRTPKIVPIGPYDYEQYSEGTNGGSIEFDGSNDDLTITDSADFDLSTGNWTVEFWWNPKSVNTNEGPMSVGYGIGSNPTGLKIAWENDKLYAFSMDGSTLQTGLYHDATAASLIGEWNHIAVVYNGSNTEMYLNGVASGRAQSTNFGQNSSDDVRIGSVRRLSSIHYSECSITDVRIVKGTAVYSGAFTPPTGPLTATGGTYPSTTNVDTSITSGHTKLLISGTDAHVIDKSQSSNLKLYADAEAVTNAPNNSNISSTNAVSFDGTGDYIEVSDLPELGANDWTIEFWARWTDFNASRGICQLGKADGSLAIMSLTTGKIRLLASSVASVFDSDTTLSTGTWYHIAYVNDGSADTQTLYINGSADANSGTRSTAFTYTDTTTLIGGRWYSSAFQLPFSGYIQDLRITAGKARYTSDFTVPSSPLKG